ncbi:MAG: MYG1 family protein [Sulfurimonas sp.]|nr:MYG1 family protein [Sulfurimonas sp.]
MKHAQNLVNITTHNGVFHADEAMACAIILFFYEKVKTKPCLNIIRTRDEYIIKKAQETRTTFVVDVGGKYNHNNNNFDHHQEDYSGRLSSAGMVAEKLSIDKILYDDALGNPPSELLSEEQLTLVSIIDEHDTGVKKSDNPIIKWVQLMNSNKDSDKTFTEVVLILNNFLKGNNNVDYFVSMIDKLEKINKKVAEANKEIILQALEKHEKSNVIKMNNFIPNWNEIINGETTESKWIAFPDEVQNCWTIQVIPTKAGSFEFSADRNLNLLFNESNSIFVHKNGFVAKVKEDKLKNWLEQVESL